MLVGGAVRDKLLGLEVKDEDWLVIGGTPEYFIKKGYEQIGKDFPVFLHPKTKDEYALARTERKVALGTNGFHCTFDTSVTAEEDLFRRDLTINAMAIKSNGDILDPFNGIKDINNKILRHVSKHFKEDPVRILRIARFMARYGELGFTIANDTMEIMKEMVLNGEVNSLQPDRILKELTKAFFEPKPVLFFDTLRQCGALRVVFPEIEALFGVPQRAEFHPEIDTGIHTMMALEQAKKISNNNLNIMFAALVHDLGKGVTPKDILPKHIGHEFAGVPLVENICNRLKVSSYTKRLALFVTEFHLIGHNIKSIKPSKLYELFKKANVFNNPKLITDFAITCEADAKGRTGFENKPYDTLQFIEHILNYINKNSNNQRWIKVTDKLIKNGNILPNEKGKKIGELIRLSIIDNIFKAIFLYPENLSKVSGKYSDSLVNFNSLENDDKIKLFQNLKVSKDTEILRAIMNSISLKNEDIISMANKFSLVNGQKFVDQGLKNTEIGIAIKKEYLSIFNNENNSKNNKPLHF